MIRRRRPTREIPFSFDSFLDVVANVVGIILRLILVTWVGARAYTGLQPPPPPALTAIEEPISLPEPQDPLTPELERQREELAATQAKLLAEMKQWQQAQETRTALGADLTDLNRHTQQLASEVASLESKKGESAGKTVALAFSLKEIQERNQRLRAEIEALKNAPSAKQTLRYRTPISHPLQSEEVIFECNNGRVTLIDIGTMLEEIRQKVRDKGEQLRTNWEVRDVTQPVGGFQLRYTLERQHEALDSIRKDAKPNERAQFQYGLEGWEVVPVLADRGEPESIALAPGSAFRRVVDSLDVNQTAVTLWVYPDSFELYRKLRDYMHDHDVTVAGRPLPNGVPIASSRHGTVSRGQ
jgi:hypothetical protein